MITKTDLPPPPARSRAQRIGDFLTWCTDRLPAPLRPWLPPDLLGFAVLGGFTLGVDVLILWALRAWSALPLPVAVSVAYVSAVALNYVLNRKLNFRSRAPVGGEVFRYGLVAAADYLLTVGVTTGLAALGIDFRIARLAAAASVALFAYCAARWFVFHRR